MYKSLVRVDRQVHRGLANGLDVTSILDECPTTFLMDTYYIHAFAPLHMLQEDGPSLRRI